MGPLENEGAAYAVEDALFEGSGLEKAIFDPEQTGARGFGHETALMENDFIPPTALGFAPLPEIGKVGGRFDAAEMTLRGSGGKANAQVAGFCGMRFEGEQGYIGARIGVPTVVVATGGGYSGQTVADAVGGEDGE
jgi:hypothetical protein